VRGRRDVVRGHLADLPDQGDDLVELRGEVVELVVGELDPRQSRQVRDLFAGNRWHELIQ